MSVTGLRFFTVYGPWGRPDMAAFKFAQNIVMERNITIFQARRPSLPQLGTRACVQGPAVASDCCLLSQQPGSSSGANIVRSPHGVPEPENVHALRSCSRRLRPTDADL